ncbi:MAG: tape measure protein [Gammaproteobacteria bacterium]|uniref:tape measure protein n=1 Tax=Rhodoferax sp. TaxID=50421 RepID=UPI00179FD014|nr:tape measure protein [Rhodoferax sp.]MBU3899190.1 tape measure protein [Gammaproteobacteria bacterium]MBA3059142.1 phage tail tape measure protein [Rhodoferax sp.]MBU4019426.1 tape measure protein [Gammaproteobacteria bacterium]MBU4081990.1 tape measure protein [Gammaproteobacteria bacterium]MBU4114015.1 tape measure protein [Gammaproteobacteria bacterium]
MANNRIAVLVALEGADDGLKRALNSAQQSLGELASTAKTAGDKAARGMAEVKAGMSAFGDQVATAKTQLLAFLSINWAAGKVQEIVQIADAWNMMGARLKLATAGQNEFVIAQKALFDIAQRIGVPIQEVSTLYGKLQQAVRMLGGEQKDALTITESISQALRLSGASATEAQSSLLQFGQALASGVLRGEEFNSVVENSPRLAQALADGLNVPIGRLRKLAEEGRLTADVVVNALMSQKDKLAAEYSQLPATVSQAFQRLQNAFGQWVAQVDAATGITKKLADGLTWLATNLDTVMQWLKKIAEVGLAVLIYRLLPALVTAWQTAGAAAITAATATSAAWATANLSVTAAIASVGLLKTAFAVLGAFAVGWEIGTWLSKKFEIVRKAGIFMVEILVKAVEQLQYRWEAFAAIFTSDTIDAATKRHEARLAEMNVIFAQMYADATKGSDTAKAAMTTAATTAEEIAKKLEAVRQGTQEAVGRGVEAVHSAVEKLKSRLGEVEQAVTKANGVVTDATAKMAEAYKGLTAMVEANLQKQVDAVKTRYQQEQTALELSSASQATQISKSTLLLTDALTQQTTLRQKATTDTLRLIDDESSARVAAAAKQGATEAERSANVTRVENEILATKRQSMVTAATEYRAHIDTLNAEANRHLAEIQRIEEAKRQLTMTTEEKIRELRRQGMTEFEATEDRKRQIVELQSKARDALAAGEFEQAKQLAQKAMDLAVQVGSTQTAEAKKAEEAKKQSEQAHTQVVTLESQAREASRKQEYDKAADLMRQADALRAELAQKTKESDAAITQGKDGVNRSIQAIRESEDILNKSLDAQAQAHKQAAQAAVAAREQIKQTLTDTETQIDQITAKLKDGLKVTLDADTSRFDKAMADLDKAMAEKERLLIIKADLEQAQKKLQEYEALLKEGKTLPVDADVSQAKAALDKLTVYAKQNSLIELQVTSEKAQASINNVEGMINALGRIRTESQHSVNTNADAARSQISSLNGMNTSSTHTIYVTKVETNATGGLVGAGVPHFAVGGSVASPVAQAFARMTGGSVPGSGDQDTVPRTLDAGAFVLRKAAVRKYGGGVLSKLANGVSSFGIAHFATGGAVTPTGPTSIKRNRDAFEAQKMIDMGLGAMREYTNWLRAHYGAALSIDMEWQTMKSYGQQAATDRQTLESIPNRSQLTANEKQKIDAIKGTWRQAMAQPLVYGKDLERELMDYMELHQGEFFRGGGISRSDTVPAMLTPGEYVVNRSAVSRFGTGFFESLNNLSLPAQALAARVQGQIQGFSSGGLVQSLASSMAAPRPAFAGDAAPVRTVRVELAAGNRSVSATVDARDESRLLDILKQAKARAF